MLSPDEIRRKIDEEAQARAQAKQPAKANSGASHEPDAANGAALSLQDWLKRDLPPVDPLLGCWLTTTSRVFLYGPTGGGKTHTGWRSAWPQPPA